MNEESTTTQTEVRYLTEVHEIGETWYRVGPEASTFGEAQRETTMWRETMNRRKFDDVRTSRVIRTVVETKIPLEVPDAP